MMDRFFKGLTYAMIPSGIVMLLMMVAAIIIGFAFIIATHVVAFESMFPAESITTVYSNYAPPTVMDNTPSPTLYPLFLCLFIDISILLGICKFFNLNINVALVVFVIVFFAPISIPCILLTYWLQSKGESIRKISLNTWKIVMIVLTILAVLVCGASLMIMENPDPEMMFVFPIIVISNIILIIHLSQRAKTKGSGTKSTSNKNSSVFKGISDD